MEPIHTFPKKVFWQEGPFQFIKPEEFDVFGIHPLHVPVGTFVSLKHPSQLRSRFGGNAYGCGLFEDFDRLRPKEIRSLQSVSLEKPEEIKAHYKEINEIYRKMGLLIRFSRFGKPYYLIPVHLISNTLTHIRGRVDEISKIIGFHEKKFRKEFHHIGVLSRQDELILHELSLRFKEHHFSVLDSPERLRNFDQKLDIVIIMSDLSDIFLMEEFSYLTREAFSKRRFYQYGIYILWKVFNLLKEDGEMVVISDHFVEKTTKTTEMHFKTEDEEKHFSLFCHIFKTKKRYEVKNHAVQVGLYDLQKYLSSPYIEQDIVDRLLGGKTFAELTIEEICALPYLNTPFTDHPFLENQEKAWPKIFSVFFDESFLKPAVPEIVQEDWQRRFYWKGYTPDYLMTYLGQKKSVNTIIADVKNDVLSSNLMGCSLELVADYRDSFEYVIRTLRILASMKNGDYKSLPKILSDRLKQPFENRKRRHSALAHVIKLTGKVGLLEKIRSYLNPDAIEGPRTALIENLPILYFFGFTRAEMKEIVLIVLGHTPSGRIISGKVSEKALKPVSDMAGTYDQEQALNLFRYCRLMTMAETEAARGKVLTSEEVLQLLSLYESTVRVMINAELDWDQLLEEKISSMGGMHNKIIQKVLMMMNYAEFLAGWPELRKKGRMQKEALADYDEEKLARIENVIRLQKTVTQFENMYFAFDPLQHPVFYRRFLEMEFHGTGHLFQKMDSRNVFVLLWIAVHLAHGKIINFNPVLADVERDAIDNRIRKVGQEARFINIRHLNFQMLNHFKEQLGEHRFSFVTGTGFQFKIDEKTKALELHFQDIQEDIERAENLLEEISGIAPAQIPVEKFRRLEIFFLNLESFFKSHQRLLKGNHSLPKLPLRHKRWVERILALRTNLKDSLLLVLFSPQRLFSDLDLLYHNAPTILGFLIPEFMALKELDISGRLYMTSPVTVYIMAAAKKFQALVTHEKQKFQDEQFLHSLAQKEFGPMATGTVGISEEQLESLEKIVNSLRVHPDLFDALTKSFLFQDIGRVVDLRERYSELISPADTADAGAIFLEKERVGQRYHLSKEANFFLIFLVKYHSLLYRNLRGEIALSALRNVLIQKDKDLFDAFFVLSVIMLSAIREDLILEDFAGRLFQIRSMCHKIIDGKMTLKDQFAEFFEKSGALFYSLEKYKKEGFPEGLTPADFLESGSQDQIDRQKLIRAGKMISAMERIFRLRGIRYVEFQDLVNLELKFPLEFIHKKRKFHSVGYATFEKEVYEAFRIYKSLNELQEDIRHFILEKLVGDQVRIYGYEKVSGFLRYENQITLLFIGLLGMTKVKSLNSPVSLNFLPISEKIENRYEAVNESLTNIPIEDLWRERDRFDELLKAGTGIILKKEAYPDLLSIDFKDKNHISHKISYMSSIKDVQQLENYFHHSLQALKKHPYYTEDYELQLKKAFDVRMNEITETALDRITKQMDIVKDFEDLHTLVKDLLQRGWEQVFSREQKHLLNYLYEMRKDKLKAEKLNEIETILGSIQVPQDLMDYWDGMKGYLQRNRRFFGRDFENLIAAKFDQAGAKLKTG